MYIQFSQGDQVDVLSTGSQLTSVLNASKSVVCEVLWTGLPMTHISTYSRVDSDVRLTVLLLIG
jgi:hypothetical protein